MVEWMDAWMDVGICVDGQINRMIDGLASRMPGWPNLKTWMDGQTDAWEIIHTKLSYIYIYIL